jgi:tetratricopeptide (TPR) repeat protein
VAGCLPCAVGHLDRGLSQLRQACLAFPLSPHVWYFLAEAYHLARDFSRTAAVSTEALQLHPNCWYLHATSARALTMLGDYPEALRHLRLAKLLCPEPDFDLLGAVAYVHAVAGRRDRAVNLLSRIVERPAGGHVSSISLAMIQAALGDKDRALNNIEAACAAHDWYIPALKRDCCVDPLRTDPRFRSLLSRVGI